MFKAVNACNNLEIIILDIQGDRKAVEDLRAVGRKKELVCPECKELVLVRAGENERRRWHFAHVSVGDCSLQHQSASILEARRIIYHWLQSKKLHQVTLEKKVAIRGKDDIFPRPVDCYAETGKGIRTAYWIFEHGMKRREDILLAKDDKEIIFNWVFLSDNLRIKRYDSGSESIILSTTERDFLSESKYNQIYSEFRAHHIHYIDIETESLITIRGISLKHLPQEFYFEERLVNSFSEIKFDPKTGEFVHPGEFERLKEYEENLKFLEKRRIESENRIKKLFSGKVNLSKNRSIAIDTFYKKVNNDTEIENLPTNNHKEFKSPIPETIVCNKCGQPTEDWVSYNPNICKKCMYSK